MMLALPSDAEASFGDVQKRWRSIGDIAWI